MKMSYSAKAQPVVGAARVSMFGDSIWTELTPLAQKCGAVNLGQGFPDWDTPDFLKNAAADMIQNQKHNQYARAAGTPNLCKAIASFYGPLLNRNLNWESEVLVSNGASSALFTAIHGLINPGDEVILFEPFFDLYPAQVIMAGGVPRYVPLRTRNSMLSSESPSANDVFYFDRKEIEAVITPRTKMIIINTPNNPTGKTFSLEELNIIADIAKKHNLIVLADEVYEFITFDNAVHHRIATLPDMWQRTLTISSASKTFSVTGWKIGWMIGPKELVFKAFSVSQYLYFSVATPLQEAVAVGLNEAQQGSYLSDLRSMYHKKRDKCVSILRAAGLQPIMPAGTFFALANTSGITAFPRDMNDPTPRDHQFSRWLTKEIKVSVIPPSAFYSPTHREISEQFVRFCFCKRDEVLDEAGQRLLRLKKP